MPVAHFMANTPTSEKIEVNTNTIPAKMSNLEKKNRNLFPFKKLVSVIFVYLLRNIRMQEW
jgi:hypothetical protein